MSGDRLAEIEALARSHDDWVYHDDVLALVEIAKQARTLTGQPFGQHSPRDFYKLREEVARLDSGAAEGDA